MGVQRVHLAVEWECSSFSKMSEKSANKICTNIRFAIDVIDDAYNAPFAKFVYKCTKVVVFDSRNEKALHLGSFVCSQNFIELALDALFTR